MSAAAMLRNIAVRWLEVRPSLRPPTRWRISSSFVRPEPVSGSSGQAFKWGKAQTPKQKRGPAARFRRWGLERIGAGKSRLGLSLDGPTAWREHDGMLP